jgi:hypothetical protein
VLAALLNALRVVDKEIGAICVVVAGVGAPGVAVTKSLLAAGVRDVVGCDPEGVVDRDRPGPTAVKARLRVLSDLHLERAALRPPRVDADGIVLAGEVRAARAACAGRDSGAARWSASRAITSSTVRRCRS